ncbi:serine/threonine protein kinase [Archangium primigenium]|uniref:serine/threonine protein kinase n=1 Tax=[Archangium] primigenium TaxID=2792470 RepID=UPI00195DAFAC|nr:serine/threonine-protein kinase [Archangium primigenium]MBM7118255.1 serine/threonine protein kinase [Archangium primigenium]
MSKHPGDACSSEVLAPGTRVGSWRVVEPLGQGGQGTVYRVEDVHHPGDFYALKLALYARDGRAEREVALMMGRAVHPHVVGFHGCARWPHPRDGRLGVIMDWVPGQALDVWAESGAPTFRQFAALAATVARTLGELHVRGVFHRDLKPEHIQVRASDGQPVLLDFGVGWYSGAAPLTTTPLPPVTLCVLSPEAVSFLWRSPRRPSAAYAFQPTDDLYALGVCLYRATTGHYPFPEWWPPDVLQSAIVHVRPQAPRSVNPRVPRALSDLIVRLLEKDPRARFRSGEALDEALRAAVRDGAPEWDMTLFAWEAEERSIVRPPRPRPSYSSAPPVAAPPAPRSHGLRLALLSAVVVGALVPVICLAPVALTVPAPEEEWMSDVKVDPVAAPSEQAPLPVRNQKLAPCTEGLEVELSGGCWLSLRQGPPNCPRQTVAYKGQCLLPVPKSRPIPTSVDGGAPTTP